MTDLLSNDSQTWIFWLAFTLKVIRYKFYWFNYFWHKTVFSLILLILCWLKKMDSDISPYFPAFIYITNINFVIIDSCFVNDKVFDIGLQNFLLNFYWEAIFASFSCGASDRTSIFNLPQCCFFRQPSTTFGWPRYSVLQSIFAYW